jgi:hypothetical protein
VDLFSWNRPEFLSVVSAGNLGKTARGSSVIASPATSKNALAVGASMVDGPELSAVGQLFTMRVKGIHHNSLVYSVNNSTHICRYFAYFCINPIFPGFLQKGVCRLSRRRRDNR